MRIADNLLLSLSTPRQPFLAAGAIIWVVSMVASAFCTEVWQFFLTMVRARLAFTSGSWLTFRRVSCKA